MLQATKGRQVDLLQAALTTHGTGGDVDRLQVGGIVDERHSRLLAMGGNDGDSRQVPTPVTVQRLAEAA